MVGLGAALLLLGSACGPPAASGGSSLSAPPAASLGPSPSGVAREAVRPDPNFDYGFTIQITAAGFYPHWLVAPCCRPITWKNLSNDPVSVIFDASRIDSGPIPPGGTWSYTPKNVQSIAYHSPAPPMQGVIQVNQTVES